MSAAIGTCGRAPHRGAARRSVGRCRRTLRAARRRLHQRRRLVAGIKKIAPFEVSVACYPEKHPEIADRRRRHRHAEGGRSTPAPRAPSPSSSSITTSSSASRPRARPPASPSRSCRASSPSIISSRSRALPRVGTSVPDWLGHRFEGLEDDQETRYLVAAAVAAEQVLAWSTKASPNFTSTR